MNDNSKNDSTDLRTVIYMCGAYRLANMECCTFYKRESTTSSMCSYRQLNGICDYKE